MDAGQPGISNRGEDLVDEGVTASLLDKDKHAEDAEQMGMSTTTEVARPQSAGLEMRWWTSTTAWLVMGIGLGMVIAAQRRLTDGPVLLSARDSAPASDQASDSASSSPAGPGIYDDGLVIATLNTAGAALFLLSLAQWWLLSPSIKVARQNAEVGRCECVYLAAIFCTCVLALAVEIWSSTITFRVVRWTMPAYHFQPAAFLNDGAPSSLLVQGTLQPSGIRYTIFPRQISQAGLKKGPPFKVADLDTDHVPRPSPNPGTLSIAARVDVGSFDELEHERGIAHFAEHLAFDAAYGKNLRKRYGIWHALDALQVVSNAYTSNRATVYELNAFKNDSRTITSVFRILNQQLFHSMPVQDNMDIEKGAVIGENRMRNDTASQLDTRQGCDFFGSSSQVCSREPIGLDRTVRAFTAHDVLTFLNKWYHPSRVHLYVAGDVNGKDLEVLISNVFANASRGGLEKNKEPAPHADPAAGSHANIFKSNDQDKATMPVNSNITAEPFSAEMRMYSNVVGFDGVTFELQASDPVSSKYELPPFRAATRLRHIHENLFAYIYAHMVLEQVGDRYGDEVPEEMPDIDVSAALQDSYQMATRFHSWRLHIGAGLGGEKGAASAGNDGNAWQGQWRTELHSALVELRRLAVHGPDPELLDKAVRDYRQKNQKATDSFYDLETFEIVEQLYGEIGHVDRQQFNTWHSPAVIEEDEVLMTHPSMMTAAFHSIQAEAGLLWDSILASVYSALFGDNVEEKARSSSILASIRQRETKLSSENSFEKHVLRTSGRALFTVASAPVHSGKGEGAESMRFMGAKSTVGINQYTLRAVVLSVAELALPEKKSSLTTLKSDNEIFFLDKEDDARWQTSVRHRKYVRRPVQPIKSSSTLRKVRRKERRLADKKTLRSQFPLSAATLFSRAPEAPAAEAVFQHVIGSHEEQTRSHAHVRSHAGQAKLRLGKSMNSHESLAFLEKEQPVSNVSDSVAALFRTSLGNVLGEMASFETFTNRGNSLIDLERLKTKFVSAMEVNAYLDSASAKSTFKEGASLVSSDKNAGVFRYQLLNGIGVNVKPMRSGDSKIPSVHRGELRMEIVSLGGKATLPASLVGGCDVVEASGSSGKIGAGTVGGGDVGGDAKSKGQEGSSGEFQGVQYYHRGTPFRDEEEFSADTIAAASENAGEFSSQWSDLQNLVNSVAEDKSLPGPPSAPSLSCSEEHMVISVLLLGKCKVHSTCAPQAVPASIFLPTLSLARVAMRPMFTSRSIRRAFAAAVGATASRKRDHDPSSAATSNGVEKILRTFLDNSTAFGGQRDHRLRRVMPEDIGRINPLELTDWAREQFVPERMEINIVGDIPDRRGLLAALNLIFGTIPRFNATAYSLDHNGVEKKVGFDPYDPMDAKYFERSWPARLNKPTELSEQACFVRDANPRRAFVNVLVPSFDMLQTRGSAMSYAVEQMASRLLSRAIRMHNGFSYFTHLESFHSSLFPGWGFWHGAWLTGNQYAVRDGKADPLNVRASADVGTIALSSSLKRAPRKGDTGGNGLNEYYFKADKALLLGKLRAKFQSTEPWLELLRGMSLSLPANMAKAIGKAAGDETTVRDVREASLLEELQVLTYKEFTRWTQKNAPPSSIELVALKSIVETVDDRGAKEPLMARVECDPNA